MQESFYLLQALEEAKKGRGLCAPNPAVGAIAVQNNKIIARGYHSGAGKAHAEIDCMAKFPKGTADVTLYISLEPCNHFGKTPPCVNAIIDHGIKRVVYGILDPNDVVRKLSSEEILAKHNIASECMPLPEITEFYKSYVYWCKHNLPWVSVKWAQTLDAYNALQKNNGHFTDHEIDKFTHYSRLKTDIILTTAKTILADNARFTARVGDGVYPKPLAIIDRNLSLSGMEMCFSFARPVYVFYDQKCLVNHLPHVKYISQMVSDDKIDMLAVFNELAKLGFHDVWVEAGTEMTNYLHKKRLVNTSHIYIAPLMYGMKGKSAYNGSFECLSAPSHVEWIPMGRDVRALIHW